MEKRNEIRISNIDDVLFGKIKLLAKNNKLLLVNKQNVC